MEINQHTTRNVLYSVKAEHNERLHNLDNSGYCGKEIDVKEKRGIEQELYNLDILEIIGEARKNISDKILGKILDEVRIQFNQ